MTRRLLARWEALPARWQIIVSTPTLFVVIVLGHVAFFPLVGWVQAIGYAAMEAVPLALVVTFATQVELAKRRRTEDALAARRELNPSHRAPDDRPS